MDKGFDFDKVMQEAKRSSQTAENREYKYKLLYPNYGNLTVKLLFNPKSNLVKRLINRHTVQDGKVMCLRTYGNQKCPICETLTMIKNSRGTDLGRLRSVSRGISYAQFIKADYKVEGVQEGDIILLMYPWTVYKDIGTIISNAKTNEQLESMIASNEGYCFTINRGKDNKYSTILDPFTKYKSRESDDEFMSLLNEIEDLSTTILPAAPTDEDLLKVDEVVQELTNTYLNSHQPQYHNPVNEQEASSLASFAGQSNKPPTQSAQMGQQITVDQLNQQTPKAESDQTDKPTVQGDSNVPECYGRHGLEDPNKCILCPVEIDCMETVKASK